MPSIDLLVPSPIPANLPIVCAIVSSVPPPNRPESMLDPVSASEFWPEPPMRFLRLSSDPDCCVSMLVSWRAPLGEEATSAKLARSAGIAPAMAFCATLRSRPRAEAIFAIMSGVRNCITTETKFVAMADPPEQGCSYPLKLIRPVWIASPKFNHLILQPCRTNPSSTKAATISLPSEEVSLLNGRGYANRNSMGDHHRLYRWSHRQIHYARRQGAIRLHHDDDPRDRG